MSSTTSATSSLVATNRGAPNWRVVLIDPANIAEANWKTVLAERPEPLDSVTTAGGKLFATYLKDVATRAYVYSLDGTLENEIALPGSAPPAASAGRTIRRSCSTRSIRLSVPPTIYRYDIATRASSVFRAPNVPGYDAARVRDEAGVLPEQGRHADPDVPRLPQGPRSSTATTRRCSTATAASTSS